MNPDNSKSMADYLVSLPMYDWPEQHASNDRFWTLLRTEMLNCGFTHLPLTLTRDASKNVWENPLSLLTQTCGFPLVHSLKQQVHLLGTPCYDVPSFENGQYASVILVREDSSATGISDFCAHRVAISSDQSQSGSNALRAMFAQESLTTNQSFNNQTVVTGSHRESIHALINNRADLCAIDPVSWQLAQRYEPLTANLRVLSQSQFTPALPLICSRAIANEYTAEHSDQPDWLPETIRLCWNNAIAADKDIAKALMLNGIIAIDRSAYEAVRAIGMDEAGMS